MLVYVLKRCLIAVPLMLAVLLASFLMLWAMPGDPVRTMLGRQWNPEQGAILRHELGLDRPLPVQFGNYVYNVTVEGDLGRSFRTSAPITGELSRRIPATVELALVAMILATITGISVGILTALKPRSWRDMLGLTGALAGVSAPIFWLGIMAQRMFQENGWLSHVIPGLSLPTGGRHAANILLSESVAGNPHATGFYLYDTLIVFGDTTAFLDVLAHIALPAMVLATIPAAMITRITRAAIGEVMLADYIRTARAKGLGIGAIVMRHALRNAAIPIVTTTGTQLGYLLGGAVLTETIFSWPGLGRYVIDAVDAQDIPQLQGAILFIGIAFIGVNLVVDLSYSLLDPRVRRSGGK